jgi:hypothetical protein
MSLRSSFRPARPATSRSCPVFRAGRHFLRLRAAGRPPEPISSVTAAGARDPAARPRRTAKARAVRTSPGPSLRSPASCGRPPRRRGGAKRQPVLRDLALDSPSRIGTDRARHEPAGRRQRLEGSCPRSPRCSSRRRRTSWPSTPSRPTTGARSARRMKVSGARWWRGAGFRATDRSRRSPTGPQIVSIAAGLSVEGRLRAVFGLTGASSRGDVVGWSDVSGR